MTRILLVLLGGIAVAGIAAGYMLWRTHGQGVSEQIYLHPVDELPQGQRGQERIYGGRPAKSGEFAASFYFDRKRGPCTATLIGPFVLFTAAHCVPKGDVVFELGGGGKRRRMGASCSYAPGYPKKDETADYALCSLKSAIENTRYFETINTDEKLLASGKTVLLTGYGCTEDGNSKRAYYVGEAEITGDYQPNSNEFRTDGKAVCVTEIAGVRRFGSIREDEEYRLR